MRFKRGESNIPGLRERRVVKTTGTTVALWDAEDANISSDHRWVVTCEDHRTMTSYATLAEARVKLSTCEWCDECQGGLCRNGEQLIQSLDDLNRTDCWACGERVVWNDQNDELGEPLCEDGDAVLLDGPRPVGAFISGRVYCQDCTPKQLHDRCFACAQEREIAATRPASTPILRALASGTALSVLAADLDSPIEVIDVAKLPEPPPGSWAAKLRDELLKARKGEN